MHKHQSCTESISLSSPNIINMSKLQEREEEEEKTRLKNSDSIRQGRPGRVDRQTAIKRVSQQSKRRDYVWWGEFAPPSPTPIIEHRVNKHTDWLQRGLFRHDRCGQPYQPRQPSLLTAPSCLKMWTQLTKHLSWREVCEAGGCTLLVVVTAFSDLVPFSLLPPPPPPPQKKKTRKRNRQIKMTKTIKRHRAWHVFKCTSAAELKTGKLHTKIICFEIG